MNYLAMFITVLLTPVIIMLVIGFWVFIGSVLDWLFYRSVPPYCDIDPLNHPWFTWDRNGNGRIGGKIVIKAKSGD